MGDYSTPAAGGGLKGPRLPGVAVGGGGVDPSGFAALYGGEGIAPGEPTPGGGIPGGSMMPSQPPQAPMPPAQPTGTGPGAAPPMRSITRDSQGRVVGVIGGKRYYRDSENWLQADLADQYNGGSVNSDDPDTIAKIRAGMIPYNEGLNRMTVDERARGGGQKPVAAPWLTGAGGGGVPMSTTGAVPKSVIPLSSFSSRQDAFSTPKPGPGKPGVGSAPSNDQYAGIRAPDAFLPHGIQGNGWLQMRAALGDSTWAHLGRLQQRIGEDGSPRVTDDDGQIYNTAFASGIRYGHIQPSGGGNWIDVGGNGADKSQWAVTVYDSTGRVLEERRGFTPQDEAALGSPGARAQRDAFFGKVLESGGVRPGPQPGTQGGGGLPPALMADGGVIQKQAGGKRLAINGKPAIVGEGQEDEAVLPLSSLQDLVTQAASKGAQQALSGVYAGPVGSTLPQKSPGRAGKAAAGGVYGWDGGDNTEVEPPRPVPTSEVPFAPGQGPQPLPGSGPQAGGLPGSPNPRERGEGGSYVPFAGYQTASYNPYRERDMSPQEKAQVAAITDIARQLSGRGDQLYNVGSGAYSDAVKYYQTLLKGNRGAMMGAVAPTAELIREQSEGARQGTLAGMGRGGMRDLALSRIGNQSQGDIARLTAGVQPGAAQALGALGGQGIGQSLEASQAAAGAHGSAASLELQARQFEEDLAERSKQFGAGLTENSRQFGTQLSEQSRQFGASLAEQIRSANMSYDQANAAMQLQQSLESQKFQLAQEQFQESIRQFNQSLQLQREGIKSQKSASKGQAWGAGIAGVATVAAVLI